MKKIFYYTLLLVRGFMTAPALHASPISSCASDFSSCNIYEDGMTLVLPGLAISADVVVKKGMLVVDVFRINNDVVDTGGGTGIGHTAFLFAANLDNLPNPLTYSVNAVTIAQGTTFVDGYVQTTYIGNGTNYNIFTSTPEPGSVALLGLGAVMLLLKRWKRALSHAPYLLQLPGSPGIL